MSEKAEGGLSDTSNPMWEKSERAARKYCGSYGYEQEPMKLARIIYDAICEPAPALQSLTPEREAVELVAWRYRYKGTTHWKYVDHENECNLHKEYERQPIYAALKPAAGNEYVSVPKGWAITRTDKPPFKSITVKAPNGYVAVVSDLDMNPKNVLYMLADSLLAAALSGG